MEETRYIYSINPKKIIKFLCGKPIVPAIRNSRSLSLTKEEVRECLKYGTVYRRFANESRNERVTTRNIDRLHNAKFMTEEEYEKFLSSTDTTVEEKPAEESVERGTVLNNDEVTVAVDTKVEEIVPEEIVVEEVVDVEEPTVAVDVQIGKPEDAQVVVEPVEPTVEVTVGEEKKETGYSKEEKRNFYSDKNKKNYGGKNNKHNRNQQQNSETIPTEDIITE